MRSSSHDHIIPTPISSNTMSRMYIKHSSEIHRGAYSLACSTAISANHIMSLESRFQISVPDDALALLQRKLADVRFPDELSDVGWDYGAPLSDVKRLVNKWKDSYDWRAHERELNQLPMFTRDIEVEGFGILNIQYIHQRSELESAIPLLFVHGCT